MIWSHALASFWNHHNRSKSCTIFWDRAKIGKVTHSKTSNVVTMAEEDRWIKQTRSTKWEHDDAVPSFTDLTQSNVHINQAEVCLRGISSLETSDPGQRLHDKLEHGSRHLPWDWAATCTDMPCWNESRWSGSSGQNYPSFPPHPVSHLANP